MNIKFMKYYEKMNDRLPCNIECLDDEKNSRMNEIVLLRTNL